MSTDTNPTNMHQHILLVEDDDALLAGMSDLLETVGYRVSRAINGKDALRVLESLPECPDLIVSDIRMPVMDGYHFLDEVRKRTEWLAIPFIFLTAKGEKEDIREGKLRGVDDYVTKPFEFQDLLVSIQACLSRHERLDALHESQIESLRRRILTTLNHEFRTPLSLIVAYADLMAASPSFKHSDELRRYINGILDGSERLSYLIESFLILVELESGYAEKLFEQRKALITDTEAIIQTVLDKLNTRASKFGVNLKVDVDKSLPAFVGERAYFEIALRHLVDNAIKFSPHEKNATVKITAHACDQYVAIDIADEGSGIPPGDRSLLFETFHQVDREKHEQQGAGVGLAIAKHVAMLHEGTIELFSEPDKGSIFRLLIPAQKTPS